MQISTKGIPDYVPRSLCKEALKYYGNELLGSRLSKNIKIRLIFDKLPYMLNALCTWDEDNHRCRSFVIVVNKNLNKKTALITLAHEMVHVKQYARGELKEYLRNDNVRWKDQLFCWETVSYWDSPWEIEAYSKDKSLYKKFKNRNR